MMITAATFEDSNYMLNTKQSHSKHVSNSKFQVELLFPRTMDQMYQLALEQFPSVGGKLRSLTITGFHTVPMIDDNEHLPPRLFGRNYGDPTEPMTLNAEILGIIKTYCTGLKSLIIRNCRLSFEHDSHTYLPDSLSKLEFYGCRY